MIKRFFFIYVKIKVMGTYYLSTVFITNVCKFKHDEKFAVVKLIQTKELAMLRKPYFIK